VSSRLLPGVFTGSHAIADGLLTRRQLRERSYRRLVQGVYADPSLPLDHRLRCQGVALLLPPGAVIGAHSAAAWHGAPFAGINDPVTVLRSPEILWKGPRGTRVLRTGSLTVGDVTAMAESGGGRWGVAKVRRAAALIDPRAESPPESRVRVALELAGLAPVPQFEVREDGALPRVDFAWPEAQLAVEYDSAYHFEGTQISRDDARFERLTAAGWRVIRLTSADLHDLDAVVARIRAALGLTQ
jgi:uncharacterized protein DUF559